MGKPLGGRAVAKLDKRTLLIFVLLLDSIRHFVGIMSLYCLSGTKSDAASSMPATPGSYV